MSAPSKGWLVSQGGQETLFPHPRRSPACAVAPGMLGKPPCRSTEEPLLDSRDANPPRWKFEVQAVSQG